MATSNNSGVMAKRQSFNGRALTFVEVIFDVDITATATTPESKDSTFDKVSKVVNKNGNLLAQSYRLGAKATDDDAAEAAAINCRVATVHPSIVLRLSHCASVTAVVTEVAHVRIIQHCTHSLIK